MRRVEKFGLLSVNQQLAILQKELKEGEVLLFQYYERSNTEDESQENIDEFFDLYCDDCIYYYDSRIRKKVEEEIIRRIMQEIPGIKDRENARDIFMQVKENKKNVQSKLIVNTIKKMIFYSMRKYNYDYKEYQWVFDRLYEKSNWVLDEEGKRQGVEAIWYKPVNQMEYLEILKNTPLFSCIVVKQGEKVDNFSLGYVICETAEDYDLLIYEND